MKTLLLIRHAKSDWNHADLSDFDRPLNDRGKRDAPEMAQRLKEKKLRIDGFVSSPAKRARKTAKVFAEAFGVEKKDIALIESLYGAEPQMFRAVVAMLSDKFNSMALFSHNPGITEYANSLTQVRTDNIPTCAVFAVQAAVNRWQDFEAAAKTFLFYDFPKNATS